MCNAVYIKHCYECNASVNYYYYDYTNFCDDATSAVAAVVVQFVRNDGMYRDVKTIIIIIDELCKGENECILYSLITDNGDYVDDRGEAFTAQKHYNHTVARQKWLRV